MTYFFNRDYRLYIVSMVILVMMIIQGCNSNEPVTASNSPATVQGRVGEGNGSGTLAKTSAGVEGAVVTVAQIQSDGSLRTVSVHPVQTNGAGEFQVQVTANSSLTHEVVAEKNGQRWKAIVSGSIQSNATVYSRPLTIESTVEAEVYEEIVTGGNAEQISSADVSLYVNEDLALEVWSANSAENNNSGIINLASAITVYATTQSAALTSASIGATQYELRTISNAERAAQVQFETSLYLAGNSESSIAIATGNYLQAMADVYEQTSLNAESYAKTMEIAGKAMLNSTASLSASATLELHRQVAYMEATSVSAAIEAKFEAVTGSQLTLNTVVTAGEALHAAIEQATDTIQIESAFEVYHTATINQLKLTLSGYASAITSVDQSINGNGGSRNSLDASVSSTTDKQFIISMYFNFFNNVKTSVTNSMNTANLLQVTSATEILILANMNV